MASEEITQLHGVLDLRTLGKICDPFVGTGTTARSLAALGVVSTTNDINATFQADFHSDALQPGFYKFLAGVKGVVSFITSPPFGVLDLAVPLLERFATHVAAIHVPSHYIFDAHPRRAAYLSRLQDVGRLFLLAGLERGPIDRRCLWMLVFPEKSHLDRLVARLGAKTSAVPLIFLTASAPSPASDQGGN